MQQLQEGHITASDTRSTDVDNTNSVTDTTFLLSSLCRKFALE